ncbi:TIR domain-containing protein [Vibrio parahaemolyticus]|uniref:TIR domain-containing protein n=1 Tax=Vibrio parahaemolyticus TaxID=670 RepID=UPI00215D295E|nr:TIR domain-containing protein [Vibrio parahaemolyticus]MCR9833246.1 nucleotide-binding protein [Vibrio parahaemolyticus]
MKPRIFIGSSVEGLSVAYAIQQNLTHDTEATVWDQGVFELSMTSIDSLETTLESSDFGIFVFSPDDITLMRNQENKSVRDNVLFEFGLFVGKLGRQRVFFVVPDGGDTHIPTDLLGVTPGKYDPKRQDGSLQAATGAACNQIRQAIKKLGLLSPPKVDNESSESSSEEESQDNEWLVNLFDNEFALARTNLDKLKKSMEGQELLRHDVWSKFIDFKENDYKGLQPLVDNIKSNSDCIEAQVLGLRMLSWEKYEDIALELIKELFGNSPTDTSILIVKSDCLNSLGENDEAIRNLSSYSDKPEICIKLSELYEQNDAFEKAIQILDKAYKNYPSNKDIAYRYARLLIDSDAHKEAVFLLNYLTLENPKSVEYWGYLSNTCLKLGLYDKAMTACKQALDLSNEESPWIIHNIGNMLNNKGFYTEAKEWLEKGLKLDSSSEYAHKRLASTIKNRTDELKKFSELCKEGRLLIRNRYSTEEQA